MKEKLARWLYGRYGEDAFGRFLMGSYFVLLIINLFVDEDLLNLIAIMIVVYMFYRVLSRKHYQRRKENDWYLKWSKPWRLRLKCLQLQIKDKQHRYYVCPNCKQICRVVRKNKKGTVTCPKCFHQFIRRS